MLALVRARWFSKPLSFCTDEAGFPGTNPRLAGRVIRAMGREILLFTAYFEHSVGFRSDQRQFDARRVFSHERWEVSFHSGSRFQLPTQIVARPVHARRQSLAQKLGASVVILEGITHTCRASKGEKPDIIDYFLVSTLIRPLIQKCEIVKSVPWCPHYGV